MKSIKPGRGPSFMGGIMSVFAGLFGVVWTVIAVGMGGGLFSLIVMILVSRMKGVSIIGVSALGAVFFNIGQILVAVVMLNTPQLIVTYLPILMVSGVVTGVLTGVVAQMVMKHLKSMGGIH